MGAPNRRGYRGLKPKQIWLTPEEALAVDLSAGAQRLTQQEFMRAAVVEKLAAV
jgi:hypothetical protein